MMADKYLRFTHENAAEAIPFLGSLGWFYTNHDLFHNGPYPESCLEMLSGVDVECPVPFTMDSRPESFPMLVLPNPARYHVARR